MYSPRLIISLTLAESCPVAAGVAGSAALALEPSNKALTINACKKGGTFIAEPFTLRPAESQSMKGYRAVHHRVLRYIKREQLYLSRATAGAASERDPEVTASPSRYCAKPTLRQPKPE